MQPNGPWQRKVSHFKQCVRIAQAEFDKHKPDVVVGSSRVGAVVMNINSGDAPAGPALLGVEETRDGKNGEARHDHSSQPGL